MKATEGNRFNVLATAGALLCLCASNAFGVQTWLALRSESGTAIYNGTTTQTIETQFGTNMATLPFAGTTTYDFYSPPLTQSVSLVTSDKGGGVIYMQNTASTSANDFSVSGQMQFFDYDPTTGTQTLIVDTAASPPKNVNHGQMVNWAIPNQLLVSNMTISAGHLVHIAVTLGLVSGNPSNFGFLVYNGPAGPSSSGLLPQNRSQVLNWPSGSLSASPNATITPSAASVAAGSTGNTASVPSTTGATYVWSISNGSITSGQGTSQIVWTAGSSGTVVLQVAVTTASTSTGTAAVSVFTPITNLPQEIISIAPRQDGSVYLTCGGVAGATYLVQAAASLKPAAWSTIGTNSPGNDGTFGFVDAGATNYPHRFYRTSTP